MTGKTHRRTAPDEVARLRAVAKRMRAEGASFRDIGAAIGRTEATARYLAITKDSAVGPSDPPAWVGQAREMRESGARYREIAEAIGVTATAVRYQLNPATRESMREANRKRRKAERGTRPRGVVERPRQKARETPPRAQAPRGERTPSPRLAAPDVKRAAIDAFARGEISRAELMERITVGGTAVGARQSGFGAAAADCRPPNADAAEERP